MLQGVTKDSKGLKRLQEITRSFKGLQEDKGRYKGLKRITGG